MYLCFNNTHTNTQYTRKLLSTPSLPTLSTILTLSLHPLQNDKMRRIADYIFIAGLPDNTLNRKRESSILEQAMAPIIDIGILNRAEHDVPPDGFTIIGLFDIVMSLFNIFSLFNTIISLFNTFRFFDTVISFFDTVISFFWHCY